MDIWLDISLSPTSLCLYVCMHVYECSCVCSWLSTRQALNFAQLQFHSLLDGCGVNNVALISPHIIYIHMHMYISIATWCCSRANVVSQIYEAAYCQRSVSVSMAGPFCWWSAAASTSVKASVFKLHATHIFIYRHFYSFHIYMQFNVNGGFLMP